MEKVTESMNRITRYSDEIDRLHRQVLTAVNPTEASRIISTKLGVFILC